MPTPDPQSLDAWEAANPPKRPTVWCDTLPESIRDQIRVSETSVARIVAWLHDIGYPEATANRIERWRKTERDRVRREQRQ
jgi:hypothetical protein